MFGLGWSEVILIGIVALIVIGPKDLPNMFRELGRMSSKARGMAHEFQRAMEQAADDSGVRDISKSIQAAANPAKFGADKLRQSAGMSFNPGTATSQLSAERQAAKDALGAATARAAQERRAREQAAADAAELSDEPDPIDTVTEGDVSDGRDLLPPAVTAAAAQPVTAQAVTAQAMPAPTMPAPAAAAQPVADAPATTTPPATTPAATKPKKAKAAKGRPVGLYGPDVLPKAAKPAKPPKPPKASKVRPTDPTPTDPTPTDSTPTGTPAGDA